VIRIFNDINLSERNSFHIAQRAAAIVETDTEDDLQRFFTEHRPEAWYALGGGNNILFTRDFEGVLVAPCGRGIAKAAEDADTVTLDVEAGVEWDDLAAWAVERDLWGIENLSLIPGKVGAAPVQNIGAYGAEAKDVIESVRFYMPECGEFRTLAGADCRFGYRDSIFKGELRGRTVITRVAIRLSKHPSPRLGYGDLSREVEALGGATAGNIRRAVCAIRRAKLPDTAVTGNAGSFFKNPVVDRDTARRLKTLYPDMPEYDAPQGVKIPAGWLIDRAGLKGHVEGCVGVHPRQALVLVNTGGATGGEVLAFARKVQRIVKEKFGVDIDTEVNIL